MKLASPNTALSKPGKEGELAAEHPQRLADRPDASAVRIVRQLTLDLAGRIAHAENQRRQNARARASKSSRELSQAHPKSSRAE